MFFYNPSIVTPYKEFVKTFGPEIDFGLYCENNTAGPLAEKIRSLLLDPDDESYCIHAHNAVKDFTWSAYIDKIVHKLEELH
jgi:hypothetical protein